MRKTARITSAILTLALMLLIPLSASALEITPFASSLISSTALSMSAKSGGKVSATTSIVCYSSCDKVGVLSIKIQEQSSGGAWSTVKSASGKYAYNARTHSYTLSYDGTAGKKYRALATLRAVSGSTTDDRDITSETVTAKN